MLETIERRSASCAWEIRETPDGVVGLSGYAAVFDSESHGEVVRRSAFNKTLADGADVRFLIDHAGLPLARTKSGTMRLRVDSVGLRMDIDTLDMASPTVQSLVSAIKRGDLDQMSFAFMAVRDNYSADGVRELTEVKLVDVSAVTYPWYEATSIGMKSDDMELVEARDAGDVLNTGEPMLFGTDTDVLFDKIAAVDAAIDAAQTLLGQYEDTDPIIAQAYALLCAADSALEDVQEALGIADPDDMLNESQPVDLAPDEPQAVEPMRAASDRPNVRALALDELRRTISRA
jgi:HK97 family phage prohead protease